MALAQAASPHLVETARKIPQQQQHGTPSSETIPCHLTLLVANFQGSYRKRPGGTMATSRSRAAARDWWLAPRGGVSRKKAGGVGAATGLLVSLQSGVAKCSKTGCGRGHTTSAGWVIPQKLCSPWRLAPPPPFGHCGRVRRKWGSQSLEDGPVAHDGGERAGEAIGVEVPAGGGGKGSTQPAV